ncbi:glycosyltransferase [Candidatus Woesearchaeota archaeon]|nr:glycosyltransferase [Candidatus Woesearchaeota archaeon]
MKIFFASQSFYPHIGGVSTYLLNLAIGLSQGGNEIVEVHLRIPNERTEDTVKGIKVYRIPRTPIREGLLKGYSNFKERIYKECHGEGDFFKKEPLVTYGYDEYLQINSLLGKQIEDLLEKNPTEIVHIHDFQLLMVYKNVPRGVPVILTWHIPFMDSISNHLKRFLIRHMKGFDKVIFSCDEYAKSAVKCGLPPNRVEVIHPIANTTMFRPKKHDNELKRLCNIPNDCKTILCVQRIDAKSGHVQLIKSMQSVLAGFPKARLVFIGGKSMTSKISKERENIEKEVHALVKSLGLQNSVFFAGSIEYEKLPAYYNSADIVALTSKNEGFGLAVTEGMACGKPIVATNVPGIVLQVQDAVNGFIVEPGDYEKTAEKILELLKNDKLREAMGKESLCIAKSRFSMSKGIDMHQRLYRKLIKSKTDWCLKTVKLEHVSAIITDFDRTITDRPGVINKTVLDGLDSLNKPLILVTGRVMDYAKELLRKYPVWDCIIAENGSYAYFPGKDLCWSFTSGPFEEAKMILRRENFPADFGNGVISISKSIEAKAKEVLGSVARHIGFITNADEVMLLPEGINKGISVKLALDYMGIDLKNTVIIADGENDISLFANPGFKVAVANADEKLRLLADEVTDKPSTEGVLEVIEKLRM